MQENKRRKIRSFVRRPGRMTDSQARARLEHWPQFGIDYSAGRLDFASEFGGDAPIVLEIGFGNGETFVAQAAANSENNYLGIEVHEPGVGHCLRRVAERELGNVRVMAHDAVEVLEHQIGESVLSRVNIYFPDPWPKKRHHKRRLLQPVFLNLLVTRLKPGGTLCIATDWANYAEHIDEVSDDCAAFSLDLRREHGGEEPLDRPTTKFERRGLGKGHRIVDWRLLRVWRAEASAPCRGCQITK